jgi:hypothetical protein
MALGRRKTRDSYGVPVRSAPPAQPVPAIAGVATAPAPAGGLASDFFSPPPPPAPAAPPAWQGTQPSYPAPGGQPSWQQGGYQPYGGNPAGLPPTPPSMSARKSGPRSWIRMGVGIVAALVLLAVGWGVVSRAQPIAAPTTLGGQPQIHDPQVDPVLAQMKLSLEKDNPGKAVDVMAYGTRGRPVILGLVRGRIDIDKEMQGAAPNTRKDFGSVSCAKTAAPGQVICLWSGSLSGGVFALNMKMPEVAALTEEAKTATA